jgi:hypothetical protein
VTSYTGTITDGIGSNDVQVVAYGVSLSDTFRTPEALAIIRAQSASLTDNIGMNDVAAALLGVVIAELIQLQDPQIANLHSQLSIAEAIITGDAIAPALPVSIVDAIGMSPSLAVQQMITVIEQLNLQDVLGPLFAYGLSISEQVRIADLIARFIGAGVIESMQLVEVTTGSAQLMSALADTMQLSADVSSSQLVLRATIADGIDITDAELIKMIFSAGLIDGIEVLAGYFDPSGSITTWAMNTRTHAVTEYTNYNFNSFARMGHKYLGATKDGLYDLSGDTDNGTSIIADIKSGFAQFAGVHLSSFKGAYIAARGNGSWVLKIYTGQGDEFNFAVTSDSMKTARIDMGKGIRARYFAFELISTGQDFDLDSLEFIPLIAKRRV